MPTTNPAVDHPTPAHLGDAGAALWREAVDGYDLSIPERTALLQASETLDVLAALEAGIRETGPVVDGKPSPLLIEARQQRAILVRLLGMLDLRLDDSKDRATATSRAARAAARNRWARG